VTREINAAGLDIIKTFERPEDGDPKTVNLDPFLDPVGIWTIGWGHAIRFNGRLLRGAKDKAKAKALYQWGLTAAQAEQLLVADLLETCRDVESCVPSTLTDSQFSALVSLVFNIGFKAFRESTTRKQIIEGRLFKAADAILLWNKATRPDGTKVVLPGLVRRRGMERALFLKEG
jgi:lysozyme